MEGLRRTDLSNLVYPCPSAGMPLGVHLSLHQPGYMYPSQGVQKDAMTRKELPHALTLERFAAGKDGIANAFKKKKQGETLL